MAITTKSSEVKRVLMVRMSNGDDLLKSLQQAVKENGIKNGAILSGLGSATAYHVHVVETTKLPPGDVFFKEDGPYDIISITGLVIDGRVHAHITLSNTEKALGGHLEEGTKVLTFCVVTIAETPDAEYTDWDSF